MTLLLTARVVLLALGIVVWGYGANADDARIRWVGIALLAMSLILRFFRRRGPSGGGDQPQP